MRLCIFEDGGVPLLEPLALTRPAFALRAGARSLFDRQSQAFPAREVGALIRPELTDLFRMQHPEIAVNDRAFLKQDTVALVNARWLPPASFDADGTHAHVGFVGSQVAYVILPNGAELDRTAESIDGWLARMQATLPNVPVAGMMVDYLWDLVDANAELLKTDLGWFTRLPGKRAGCPGAAILGPQERLVADESATIEPHVVFDTRPGPVLIDRGAVVQAFSRVEGPCYIGPETWIVGAKVRGGSFGAHCKLGGEIEASIIQGFSNKYHDGFLGHSYVGEWVNLAAGTQTSDLRNDYGKVKMSVANQRVATGKTKVGSFIGDHSKTALGTLLNTGSSIGVFCNVLPSGSLTPTVVPSFCQVSHGQIGERMDMRSLFTTAAVVVRRRGQEWTDSHRDFYYGLYDQTAAGRRQTLQEGEIRRMRRSG
ncbi:MAG: hypothetical protein HY040_08240 [Planctomycetes bacterium]|nr:hypothetical protein [Planctomycetota bacterium]